MSRIELDKKRKARNSSLQLVYRRRCQSNRAILKSLCRTLGMSEIPYVEKPDKKDKANEDKMDAFYEEVEEKINELLERFEDYRNTEKAQKPVNKRIKDINRQSSHSEISSTHYYVTKSEIINEEQVEMNDQYAYKSRMSQTELQNHDYSQNEYALHMDLMSDENLYGLHAYKSRINQMELQNYDYSQNEYAPQMDLISDEDYYSQSSSMEAKNEYALHMDLMSDENLYGLHAYKSRINQMELQNYDYSQNEYAPQMDLISDEDYYSQSSSMEAKSVENELRSL